jgi:hypothetical protein
MQNAYVTLDTFRRIVSIIRRWPLSSAQHCWLGATTGETSKVWCNHSSFATPLSCRRVNPLRSRAILDTLEDLLDGQTEKTLLLNENESTQLPPGVYRARIVLLVGGQSHKPTSCRPQRRLSKTTRKVLDQSAQMDRGRRRRRFRTPRELHQT